MFYKALKVSKQGIHQLIDRRMKQSEENGFLLPLIRQIRADHPTMSCRAMYYKIKPQTMGRDAFESLCFEHGFKQEKPINYHRTTNSNGVVRFDNLMENTTITAVNQAFVSDITYFELDRFYYITFVMDAFSRFVLGYQVSDRLTTEATTLPALKQAIKVRKNDLPSDIIFHSDGGGQYYDKDFLKLTGKYNFKNSMCEMAYQNGQAERINGVIKNNYLKHRKIENLAQLGVELDRAVTLYNNEKPHKSLKYKTPLEVEKIALLLHKQTKPKMTESLDANSTI